MVCVLFLRLACILPKMPLCLSRFGRDTFQEAMKISNKADMKDINWNNFKYMVYDVPDHRGTYQERFTILGTVPLPLF